MSLWDKIVGRKPLSEKDRILGDAVRSMMGRRPGNIQLYKLALLHSSMARTTKEGHKESNERLEFLGDAVLNMVVAEYLFKKYPFQSEGFLTEIRSRIVKRESLNRLAKKLGVQNLVLFQDPEKKTNRSRSIFGNALEALIGAIFLDRNYKFCKNFIQEKIIMEHLDMEEIIRTNTNYKSKIIEWAQKENKDVAFEASSTSANPPFKEFTVSLVIDRQEVAVGQGTSKKKAEQDAALKACEALKLP